MGEPQRIRMTESTHLGASSGATHRSLRAGIALVVLAMTVAAIKPWGVPESEAAGATGRDPESSTITDEAASVTAQPGAAAPVPWPARPSLTEKTCGRPMAWRAATIEREGDRTIKVSSAVEVVAASGPSDRAISFRRIVARDVSVLGYCAPVAGDDRPPVAIDPEVWMRDGGRFVRLATVEVRSPLEDGLGTLWMPAFGDPARGARLWAPGRYVIRLGSEGSYERWLGVDIVVPAFPEASSRSPDG